MQKANYLNTRTASGNSGKYPLSTQTLDFIQQQIMLLQQLGYIGGSKYILRQPDGKNAGLCYIDGEFYTLAAKPVMSDAIKFVCIATKTENIKADGETYAEARTYKTAALSSTSSSTCFPIDKFSVLVSNSALEEQVKQAPQAVLEYLKDVLAEKMPMLVKSGLTRAQLDTLLTPCVMTCTNSVAIAGQTNYGLTVMPAGAAGCVMQTAIMGDGTKFTRVRTARGWAGDWAWHRTERDMYTIEMRIVRGVVYIRHGELPADVKIIVVRKKRRSAWRSTGGAKSYTHNKGKRIKRAPKRAWVHYKGIVLNNGKADEWYVPHCIAVANSEADADLLSKEMGGLCGPLIKQLPNDSDGNEVYSVSGVRKRVTAGKRTAKSKASGYVEIGIQVVRNDADGTRMVGGEVARLKYRIQNKRVNTGKTVLVLGITRKVYKRVFYRSFSMR